MEKRAEIFIQCLVHFIFPDFTKLESDNELLNCSLDFMSSQVGYLFARDVCNFQVKQEGSVTRAGLLDYKFVNIKFFLKQSEIMFSTCFIIL